MFEKDQSMKEFLKPSVLTDSDGNPRKTGFEFEFGNLSVKQTAQSLRSVIGGKIVAKNPFLYEIHDSRLGKLRIERDASMLKSRKYRKWLEDLKIDFSPDTLTTEIEEGVDRLSSYLIPCEIVTEPLLFEDFDILPEIIAALVPLEAEGTQESFLYAFGLHMNPSVPDLQAETLTGYIQGFLLMTDWIIADSGTDFSRRYFTKFIDPFPSAYIEKVLHKKYRPDISEFMADFLEFNPTRNRALDLLPLLAVIDEKKVLAMVAGDEKELINPRPAFHYRLADCRIGDSRWSIAGEWNRWWYVERLAADASIRNKLLTDWHENSDAFFLDRKKNWIAHIDDFLKRHLQIPPGTS